MTHDPKVIRLKRWGAILGLLLLACAPGALAQAPASETRLCGAKPSAEDIVRGKVFAIPGCEPTSAEIIEAYKRALAGARAESRTLRKSNEMQRQGIARLTEDNRRLRERLARIQQVIRPGPIIGPN